MPVVAVVAGVFMLAGLVLAMATTTDNRMRWAVQAPAVWGTGALVAALMMPSWSPVAPMAGMYFYAAINYRHLRRKRAAETSLAASE